MITSKKIKPSEFQKQEDFQKYSGKIKGRKVYSESVVELMIYTGQEDIFTANHGIDIPKKYFQCGDEIELYGIATPPAKTIEQIEFIYNRTRNVAFKLEQTLD